MAETLTATSPGTSFADAAKLLHDFNLEYDEPAPPREQIAGRLRELVDGDRIQVLVGRDRVDATPVGVAVMRLEPSLWSRGQEAYLAELYVVPHRRGEGFGRELITEAVDLARSGGADYMFLVTSEDDVQAQRLYEAAGFRRTEGEGGPLMLAFERDL